MNANTITGAHDSTAPEGPTPNSSSVPTPCCQTSVITPQVAKTDSRFIAIAFAGSTIERNARASSTNVTTEISTSISGKEP